MTPDPQLLIANAHQAGLLTAGTTARFRFNLQRGQIARVLGFHVQMTSFRTLAEIAVSVHFRKQVDATVAAIPTDLIWSHQFEIDSRSAIGQELLDQNASFNLPKPYRTPGIMCTVASTSAQTAVDVFLLVYYDVDTMTKDEDIQYLESTRQRGISRVA